jgi:C1A family cysteine protease
MSRTTKRYGWIPDLPDHRDFRYASPMQPWDLPESVDLEPLCPSIYDQGELGSCTANAIGSCHQYAQMRQNPAQAFMPSRLFIYYNERVMINTVNEDSGAMLRDGLKSVAQQGVCPETPTAAGCPSWPYDIAKFARKPPAACYEDALTHQVLLYRRITQTLTDMQGCLASGFPFTFGCSIFESFESATVAKTGMVPMPRTSESLRGGHAMKIVGYRNSIQRFKVRNSWGKRWGLNGYCWMPYSYILNPDLSVDFWTIRLVEEMT